MKTKIMLSAAAMALIMTACNTPNPITPDVEKIPIKLAINQAETKATDTSFENGDEVGVYAVVGGNLATSGNHVDNMRFTYNGTWTPDEEIFWKDPNTREAFYCYYPYAQTVSSVTSYEFPVRADQSTDEGYKASDLLWGKTDDLMPSENPVAITVNHLMSNVLIVLKAGEGYKEEDLALASVKICSLASTAKINLTNGNITATGVPAEITPKQENGYYRALVVPQSVTDADIVKVSISGYNYVLRQSVEFKGGHQHKCTLTLNKTSNGINISIGGWETDDQDFGGTLE